MIYVKHDSCQKGGKGFAPFEKTTLHTGGGQRFKSSTAHHAVLYVELHLGLIRIYLAILALRN